MRAGRLVLGAAGLLAFVWAAAYVDLTLRARSACLEGEKWLEWDRRPELKRAFYDDELKRRTTQLAAERDSGTITPSEYEKKLFLARFERDQAVKESSLKYAYVWFQSAAELFTPPENRWTRRARARMIETRVLWKAELDRRKIPYQDYMLE